jgi:zinc protease
VVCLLFHHVSQYALRLPIGNKDTIERGAQQDLVRFYKNGYRPELITLVAVGDFDPNQVQALFEKYFHSVKVVSSQNKQKLGYFVADNSEPLVTIETAPELTRTSVEIQIKQALIKPVTYQQYYQTWVYSIRA